MTKQEGIREGIENIILATYHAGSIGTSISDVLEVSTEELLKKLHSRGVVIKVDRELPPNTSDVPFRPYSTDINAVQVLCGISNLYNQAQQDMLKAGYVAVEPLMEEKE